MPTADAPAVPVAHALRRIALVGHPNTGKSTLFNVLTGLNQKTGNFAGVTVDRRVGTLGTGRQRTQLVDLPGTYGLYPKSEDEAITARILQQPADPDHPDAVLVVADATNLRPGILLATQVIDLGFPTLLVVNLADLAPADPETATRDASLARQLGIPVLRVSARRGWGIPELRQRLQQGIAPPAHRFFRLPEGLQGAVQQARQALGLASDYAAYQLLLTPGPHQGRLASLRITSGIQQPQQLIANETVVRYDRIADILAAQPDADLDRSERRSAAADRVLLHPVWGYVCLIALLLLLFQAIFTWAAYPMDWIDAGMAAFGERLQALLPAGWFQDFLVNGLVAGIQGIVVFVPQIALLFFFLAVLEELGYLSRVVFLTDRLMRPFGLSGRSVVPLFGGFACAVPSILAVRGIPSRRERLITILTVPLMSCSARIPVYTVLIAVFVPAQRVFGVLDLRGLVMAGFYLLGLVVALLVSLVLKWRLQPAAQQADLFVVELPNFRRPRWQNVARVVYDKAGAFVVDAGKVILVLAVVLWFLANYAPPGVHGNLERQYQARIAAAPPAAVPQLEAQLAADKLLTSYAGILGRSIEPAIRPLGYDWKIGIALISSFAAREVFVSTMNTLYAIGTNTDDSVGYATLTDRLQRELRPDGQPVYSPAVALSLLVFYALALQCMSTLAVIRRETGGWRWALLALAYQSALAYLLAMAAYQLLA